MRAAARLVLGGFVSVIAALVALGHFLNWRRLPSEQVDAALVFGCGEAWKAASRCATAATLFQRGLVRWLVVSGGVTVPGTAQTEAVWFRDNLAARGVPAGRILLEGRATNTAENATYALPILKEHGFAQVVLVMSDFEGIRAHLTAKRAWRGHGITIYDCHAPSVGHWNAWTWWLSPEGWALTFYTVPRLFRYRLLRYLWQNN
ncbi:MAG: YdcF family protein [Chloroflexales bacterium]|nr:YdcF family protein [Chloroflexales bacterium]